ncbi:MAG TPA: 4-hydroxy-tetrahydrodipicolinate reductase [Syntrophomonadaceae bacterium]|nr:4-hydroxy-tetrahydrodipicolinate reductase [Syntrophomonadaceae bacterium]HNX29125.1 4-hydroxy-tetrahydrodipicolinate reductase [Syntrophomonadaceae bacterium]HPR93702.1 4-hydroxy-tetrahydrodipicolinate reductase [Syntrophomonadaceae bacterium]
MADKIKVVIAGALGKMGQETVNAILNDEELQLVALVDVKKPGDTNIFTAAAIKNLPPIDNDLIEVIDRTKPDVLIDFTNPQSVFSNAKTALLNGISCVLGTTGLNDIEIEQLEKMAIDKGAGVAIIPNFAIGAVLMMKFAREAARYFNDVEIIELHHDQKLDAPSGTAIKTAEMINDSRSLTAPKNLKEYEKIAGARGGDVDGVRIHSVRLPGLVAHQEVIFGGAGQTMTIRHDTIDRACFMPGVVMVTKKILNYKGLIHGMDKLM